MDRLVEPKNEESFRIEIFKYFFFQKQIIGAIIRIEREIQCLSYAEFFLTQRQSLLSTGNTPPS